MAVADIVDGLGPPTRERSDMNLPPAFRPCLAISGSVIAFALLIERAGFPAAVMLTVLIASSGSRQLRVRQLLLLAVIIAAAMSIVFVGLLHQPFQLVPWI